MSDEIDRVKIECLYMFHYGNMVKVGISNDPWRRIATLQTAVPEDLDMPYLVVTQSRELVAKWEKSIHKRLAHRRVRGEWFRVDVEDAIEIAGRVVDQSTRKLMKGRPTFSFQSVDEAMAWAGQAA